MKKIMVVLLCVAAAMNAMAIDYTAKAKVTLTAVESTFTCDLKLSEYADAGALNGSAMNMEDRKVALYALNGGTKLEIAKAADLRNVPLGLLTDASTNYTLTVSSVAGTETLYIHDNVANADYALTEGASYNFTATASTTDETRFYLKKGADALDVCFIDNKLQINGNPYSETIVIKDANGDEITGSPFAANTLLVDFSTIGAAGDRFTVEFAGGARKFIVVKQ
ncbi:MAG: hypothetical protein IJT12_06805 [Paludibacteraceae bacterium]|nr:hypothetical protein [Paludibacteraceae bacterium]